MRILVVDHDPWARELAAEVIERLGHEPLQAGSAEDAVDIATRTAHIRLLLTAVTLPATNGLELAAYLRDRFPHLKVIYMSGPADAVRVHGTIHPGSAPLIKPFTREQLAYELGVLLGDLSTEARSA